MVKSHPKSKITMIHSNSNSADKIFRPYTKKGQIFNQPEKEIVLQVEMVNDDRYDLILETVLESDYFESEREKEIQYLESGLERYHVQVLEDEIKKLHRIAENGETQVRFFDDDYEEPICGRCGVRVEDGDNYCRVCGVKIDWGTNDEV